ncbi:hypothetical protein A3224_00460 [Microbulbifer thermotolerans]|uniref:Uncharacterized protein n=1 Tax=Microbulbifer thermotolerans TaxID=252514 RepID=A0A143HID5_MICTH|nr:hypothetical protein A3224_00460 [Microbulbifer thermotolerans]
MTYQGIQSILALITPWDMGRGEIGPWGYDINVNFLRVAMPYKSIIRSGVVIFLVVAAYYVGEQRGFKRGIEISAVFASSGRSADEANMIALLLGYARRGEEEKMYEWGEKFIVQNMDTYNSLQSVLATESAAIKGTRLYDVLDLMVNSYPYSTTEYYIETYIEAGKNSSASPEN